MGKDAVFVIESYVDPTRILEGFMTTLSRGSDSVKVSWAGDLLVDWGKNRLGHKALVTVSSRNKKKLENYLIGAGVKIIKKSAKESKMHKREYKWVYFLGMTKEQIIELLKGYYQALMYSWEIERRLDYSNITKEWAFTVPGQIDERQRFHKYLADKAKEKNLLYKENFEPHIKMDYVEVSMIANK